MQKHFITLTIAVFLLLATSQRATAEMITGLNADLFTDRESYNAIVGAASWGLGGFSQFGNNFAPRMWDFDMVHPDASRSSWGRLSMLNPNGGSGFMEEPPNGQGPINFQHTKGNSFHLAFGDSDFVRGFYMTIDPYSGWNEGVNFTVVADYWLDGVAYRTEEMILDASNNFFGLLVDDNAYIEQIVLWSSGTSGNGYYVEAGFGDRRLSEVGTPTPEPATLAVLGLGLAGLGVARRRMKK